MEWLNDHFRRANISFTIRDIDWIVNPTWAEGKSLKRMQITLRKGDYGALNLYYIRQHLNDIKGQCTYPKSFKEGSLGLLEDGCVITAAILPFQEYASDGKLTTHKVGHWFGLTHTFEGNNCTGEGDMIDDTPAQASASYGCPLGRDSCPDQPGLDPIHNFMDYSNW